MSRLLIEEVHLQSGPEGKEQNGFTPSITGNRYQSDGREELTLGSSQRILSVCFPAALLPCSLRLAASDII